MDEGKPEITSTPKLRILQTKDSESSVGTGNEIELDTTHPESDDGSFLGSKRKELLTDSVPNSPASNVHGYADFVHFTHEYVNLQAK